MDARDLGEITEVGCLDLQQAQQQIEIVGRPRRVTCHFDAAREETQLCRSHVEIEVRILSYHYILF